MQYLRARYYNPASGRFNQLDPFFGKLRDPLSFNKYLYTQGDPINGTDPSGNDDLGSLQIRMAAFVSNAGMRIGSAFAAGGAAIGRLFNALGAELQAFARQIIELSGRFNITENVKVGSRFIDFVVTSGNRIAQIEVKYSIPRTFGPAFDRLVGQINAMVSAGSGQPVVWSLNPPTMAQLNRIRDAVGPDVFNKFSSPMDSTASRGSSEFSSADDFGPVLRSV